MAQPESSQLKIKQVLKLDHDTMSHTLAEIIDSPEVENIVTLPSRELIDVMDALQVLIDAQLANHRLFERFLKKLVKQRGILPPYLFLSDVRRIGQHHVDGGGFADVWRGEVRNEAVALKVLRIFDTSPDAQRLHKEFCKEAMVWRQLKHKHVLPFYGVCTDDLSSRYAIVLPWMENGNLMAYLKRYPDADRLKLIEGITLGLCYLHTLEPQVIHGDLRGANILIDKDCQARLADFGLARVIDSQATAGSVSSYRSRGNVRWQAPELLNISKFDGATGDVTEKSDIYSLACVYLEIFTGEAPFSHLRSDGAVLIEIAVHDERPPRPSEPATQRGLDDRMWSIMEDCWTTEPNERLNAATVIQRLSPLYHSFHHTREVSGMQLSPHEPALPSDADVESLIVTPVSKATHDHGASLESSPDTYAIRSLQNPNSPEVLQAVTNMIYQANIISVMQAAGLPASQVVSGTSHYQQCIQLRASLLRIYGFVVYFILSSPTETLESNDPVTKLWDCFALGAPLCFLFNLLPNVTPITATNTDPNQCNPSDVKSVKRAIEHFAMAVSQTDLVDRNDQFHATQLLDRSTTEGFVKVLNCVTRLVARLPQDCFRPMADSSWPASPLFSYEKSDTTTSFLPEERPLKIQGTKRYKFICEFVETERKYVQDLERMQKYANAVSSSGTLDQDTVHLLFPGLNKLLNFQRRLLITFEACFESPWEEQNWGLCFSSHEEDFAVYELYHANYAHAKEIASEEEQNLKTINSQNTDFDLLMYLDKPMRRLYEYLALLDSLLKASVATYDSYHDGLKAGQESIKHIIQRTEHSQVITEHKEILKDLETRVQDWKGGHLHSYGDLFFFDTLRVVKDDVPRIYHAFLFEKVLIFCKEAGDTKQIGKRKSTLNNIRQRDSFKGDFPLRLKGRFFMPGIKKVVSKCHYFLTLHWDDGDSDSSLTLHCRTEQQRSQWALQINYLIRNFLISERDPESPGDKSTYLSHNISSAEPFSLGDASQAITVDGTEEEVVYGLAL